MAGFNFVNMTLEEHFEDAIKLYDIKTHDTPRSVPLLLELFLTSVDKWLETQELHQRRIGQPDIARYVAELRDRLLKDEDENAEAGEADRAEAQR